jgi:carboxylesterase
MRSSTREKTAIFRGVMISVDHGPFSLSPKGDSGRPRGVVVVHGFTGTPFEMRLLGNALAARGLHVEGPVLEGHGEAARGARPLGETGWPDWLASVERAFDALRTRLGPDGRVGVCGLSLGGLLTFELARRRPEVGALAGLATALWLPAWALALDELLQRVPFMRRAVLPKVAGFDIADREMRHINDGRSGGMPISCLHSLIELGARRAQPGALAEVHAPTLLGHSQNDHTVPFECMDALAHRLGPRVVRKLVFQRSYHVLTLDLDREALFEAVAEHFLTYL